MTRLTPVILVLGLFASTTTWALDCSSEGSKLANKCLQVCRDTYPSTKQYSESMKCQQVCNAKQGPWYECCKKEKEDHKQQTGKDLQHTGCYF